MTNDPTASIRLFRMQLRQDPDVVLCRNRARTVAEKFGFDRQDQIRIATAVSEIARNAFRYAKGGAAEFFLETADKPTVRKSAQRLLCVIHDEGPGIPNLEEILSGRYRSSTGMGTGIAGAHRLMDKVSIETGPGGTTVRLTKNLPRGKKLLPEEVQAISDTVMHPGRSSPLEELATQNHEILFMVQELNEKSSELTKVNEELGETNRGVVALYDELDTIYRVGHVLASKLELSDLLQAIINATTDISGAEAGLFVYEDKNDEGTVRQHTAGKLGPALEASAAVPLRTLTGSSESETAVLRIDDTVENGVPSPLGSTIPVRSYLSIPVLDSSGLLTGAMVFAHSAPSVFTERSERILSSVALQASIGIENARLYKNVQTASAAKDQFLAVLSHELRNPLNPVFMRLSLLEENPAMPEDAHEDLRMIRRNLELETRLIDDLLDMTRIARGKVSLKQEPVNLHEVIEAAGHACSGFAKEQEVEIVLRLQAAACTVMGDPVRLQQVFWNLLNNALKFSLPGRAVMVTTVADETNIHVTVTDTGKGITPGRLEMIFQPFEQDGEQSSRFGGLGLGLAICKSILTAHGGHISARSEGEGLGASFTVSLALTKAAVATGQKSQTPASPIPVSGFRILLVDDHKDTRTSLEKLLRRRGHDVTTASGYSEAREIAGTRDFQLLISDIGLPDGTGYQLMKALLEVRDIKGIAVSGYGMSADILKSREAGFSAHLMKPLKIADLEREIEIVMKDTQRPPPQ